MGILEGGVVGQSHETQELEDAVASRAFHAHLVDGERFADDLLDRHAGIERGIRILKDDLHLAAQGPERALIHRGEIAAVEDDASFIGVGEPEEQ